jgi:hypothetical protein
VGYLPGYDAFAHPGPYHLICGFSLLLADDPRAG